MTLANLAKIGVVSACLAFGAVAGCSAGEAQRPGDGNQTGLGGTVNGGGGMNNLGGNLGMGGANSGVGGGNVDGSGGNVNPGLGGSPGSGGSGGSVSLPNDPACGAGVTPTGVGRCSAIVKGKGSAITLHNFEEPGADNDYLGIFFADGRKGKWWKADFSMTATMAVTTSGGVAPGGRALRFNGGAPLGWGAAIGVPVHNCYDASVYKGISFYIKGNPGAGNGFVKFSIHTPISQPVPAGGCSQADADANKCYDHYAKVVPITSEWVRHNIRWADLKQNCPSNVPAGYNPATQIVDMSFSVPDVNAGFDFSIDNITYDVGDLPASGFANIVSADAFTEMWLQEQMTGEVRDLRNPFYTYQGIVNGANAATGFGTAGNWTSNRREIAAFLSNVAHETDSLALIEETPCANDTTCTQYGRVGTSGPTYHGRGPIMLTGQGNYNAVGLANDPEQVATNQGTSWRVSYWFWMNSAGAGSQTPHNGILGGSFAETINSINGALECGGKNPGALNNRKRHYLRFSYMLGVDPGINPDPAVQFGC